MLKQFFAGQYYFRMFLTTTIFTGINSHSITYILQIIHKIRNCLFVFVETSQYFELAIMWLINYVADNARMVSVMIAQRVITLHP